MIKQSERIKLSPYTKKCLEGLKTEDNWTFDLVIETLLCEHDELNDPELLEEKEKKLHQEYVPILDYNKLYDENRDNREKVTGLTDKYENKLEEIKDKEEQFATKLKEQQDKCVELKDILIAKEEELKSLDITNKELKEKLDNLNVTLSDIQKKYESCDSDYHRLRTYVDDECLITGRQLTTLFCISFFLSRPLNKKRFFTAAELRSNLFNDPYWITSDDIQEVIPLFNYKIFPVRRHLVDKVECFRFDWRYLRR